MLKHISWTSKMEESKTTLNYISCSNFFSQNLQWPFPESNMHWEHPARATLVLFLPGQVPEYKSYIVFRCSYSLKSQSWHAGLWACEPVSLWAYEFWSLFIQGWWMLCMAWTATVDAEGCAPVVSSMRTVSSSSRPRTTGHSMIFLRSGPLLVSPHRRPSEVFVSGQVGDRVSSDQQDGSFNSFQALETLFWRDPLATGI